MLCFRCTSLKRAMQYNYTVLYEQLREGGFQVHVPAMPEIVTYGLTRDEARLMAEDAIRCVLESAEKAGEPIPQDIEPAAVAITLT